MTPIKCVVEGIEFYQVNHDHSGNPRYVFHWSKLADTYTQARILAKQIGARIYRAKWYGGGLVFTSYNLERDAKTILELHTVHS